MDYSCKMLQHVSSLVSKSNHFSYIVAKTVLPNFGKKKNIRVTGKKKLCHW